MLTFILILALYLAVPITLATAALFRPEAGMELCRKLGDDGVKEAA